MHDGDVYDLKLNCRVGSYETLGDDDVLRVEVSQNYVVFMKVTELVKYLISYLTNTILRKLLPCMCQSVQIGVSLVYKWIEDINLIFVVKGSNQRLNNRAVKSQQLV